MGYTTSLGHTPTFTITKGGEEITSSFADRILSVQVCSYDGDGAADTVDIELDDRDWSIAEPSIGEGSAQLEVSLGYEQNALYDMGTFQVDEIRFKWMPKRMVLHGSSVGFNTSIKAPIITAYEGKTLGDIVGGIASAAGVSASIDPSLSSIRIPYLNQHSSSRHLLNELERRFDAIAKFGDGVFSFTQRGTGLSASGKALDTVTLNPDDIQNAEITANNYYSYSKVRAAYLDRVKNQLVWLQSNTKGSPNSTTPFMLKQPFGSQAEAQAAADAQMARLNRSTKQGTITLSKGAPEIRGGSKLIIAGSRSGIDDTFMVRSAAHMFNRDGGLGTTLSIYTEGGAEDADSSSGSSTSE